RITMTGSTDGSASRVSPVATNLAQSPEPGRGTSSTFTPIFSYQPSLVAIANGAAAELIVRAHQPTRTVVCASAAVTASRLVRPAIPAANPKTLFIPNLPSVKCLMFLRPWLPSPRREGGGGPARRCRSGTAPGATG